MAIFGADSLRLHMYKYRWISRYSSVVKFYNTVHLHVLRVGSPFSVTRQCLPAIQEEVLIKQINSLTDRAMPPTAKIVRNLAEEVIGKKRTGRGALSRSLRGLWTNLSAEP